ncbi:MAG: 1,4-dihydroxy-2-naphthoate polyprenyltransferase [Hyphomicrobiales bacterium]
MTFTNTTKAKAWLHAFRLRTLPLAFSGVLTAAFITISQENIDYAITILILITTLFLQILSNLANDYGDYKKGTDNEERLGPERALQSGKINKKEMRTAIIIFSLLSLISGIALLFMSFFKELILGEVITFSIFLLLGLVAIWAAIKYTVGKKAYGYIGLGDLFVLIFFGWVSVGGTYFLNTHSFQWNILLPATSIGLLSTAVLNLNNMRDIANDKESGKITLTVILGINNAKLYHVSLIIGSFAAMSLYVISNYASGWQYIYFIMILPMLRDLYKILLTTNNRDLDPFLKSQAINTFLFSIAFGIGLLIS